MRVLGPAHLELAEDCVQDAFIRALERWPFEGIPENPAGWLMIVARNRAIDRLRRERRTSGELPEPVWTESRDEAADQLALIRLCCHPDFQESHALH